MLISIIQINPLQNGAVFRGKPLNNEADCMRANDSLVIQLITVCGHGAFLMPRGPASISSTRETARNPMRAIKNNRSANVIKSTLF